MWHTIYKAVDERPDYQVNHAQFRYCLDWGTCSPYRMQMFQHFRSFDCTQTCVNVFGTKLRSVHNIVHGHFSGMSVPLYSEIYKFETYILQRLKHSLQDSQSPLRPLTTLTLVTTLTTLTVLDTSLQQFTTRYNYTEVETKKNVKMR